MHGCPPRTFLALVAGLGRRLAEEIRDVMHEDDDGVPFKPYEPSYPAKAGYPVRCGFSVQSLAPLGYWIVRPSAQLRTRRTMTTESRRWANGSGLRPARW